MKKVLLVMLVALIAVSAVFAEFKDNLNINARVGKNFVNAGVSYDYEKLNFGTEVSFYEGGFSLYASATYDVVDTEKSNLSLGAFAAFLKGIAFDMSGAEFIYAYKLNEKNAITARMVFPFFDLVNPSSWVYDITNLGSIGYRYSF